MRLEEDRKLGTIGLMFKAEGRLSKDERRLAKAFADQGALALERARLFEAERAARDATERLQTFATSLAAAATTREVLSTPGGGGRRHHRGGLRLGRDRRRGCAGARRRRLARVRGGRDRAVPPDVARHPIPACDAVRGGQEIWFDTLEDFHVAYPAFEMPAHLHGGGFGCVPMFDAAGRPIGVASFQLGPRSAPDRQKRADVRAIVGLAAQSLERAQLYERERTVAMTLQESLLPSALAERSRIAVASRYLPGTQELEVGGDWYDAGSPRRWIGVGLAVGDVVGHGVEAASAMGQLRSALRGLALYADGPSAAVEGLDRLARAFAPATLATIVYAELDLARAICATCAPVTRRPRCWWTARSGSSKMDARRHWWRCPSRRASSRATRPCRPARPWCSTRTA